MSTERVAWQQHVVIDPEIHHGEPCIKGTRIPVSIIIGSLADGMTFDEILSFYPQLNQDHIRAALAYAAEMMKHEILVPLAA
ncbi:MAG: DUF433 domain-containing protein [Caldilineaceae bacterium]|nr:DUF433 domain-containing protein [Caldilineaceae bacterium]MCB0124798.1 DUF433 domain-containing protein [Caldilineaceae bacterium]